MFHFISRIALPIHFHHSHQEPMMRSTPNEFSLFGKGSWDYTTNSANINQFWLEGTERARPFESVYTIGMRGFGDCKLVLYCFRLSDYGPQVPLSETTDVSLLESVIGNQTLILQTVYNTTNVAMIPQIWTLCQFRLVSVLFFFS